MTCTHPDFAQFLPADRPVKLISGDTKWTSSLLYQEIGSDKRYLVPNIWYNQPLEKHQADARSVLTRIHKDIRGLLAEWRRYQTEPDQSVRDTLSDVMRKDLRVLRRISMDAAQRLRVMRTTGCIRITALKAGDLMYDPWWRRCH